MFEARWVQVGKVWLELQCSWFSGVLFSTILAEPAEPLNFPYDAHGFPHRTLLTCGSSIVGHILAKWQETENTAIEKLLPTF